MIPFVGFAPDLQPETPGIFVDCKNVLPAIGAFVSAPSEVDAGLNALDSQCRGFSINRQLDNTNRTFAGSTTKLYERSGSTWTDVSKAGSYSLGGDDRWRFAQFGNVALATNKSTTLQYSSSSAFSDAGTAPKADIVETINNQVFVANIDGMGFGNDPTRWAFSAIGDYADWTPDVTTGCVSGQFLDSPGRISAARKLGNVMVAYKEKAMYVGQYVGGNQIWDWQRIPGDIGAPCQESVVTTGTAHFFIGPDDFYVYDGSRPNPLNSPCRNWFFNTVDQSYLYRVWGTFDRVNQRVFWWFAPKGSSGALTECVVYNVKTGQWGRITMTVEAVADYVSAGITIDGLSALSATIDGLPAISFDSPFWTSGASVVAVFKSDHKAYQLSGVSGESRITTGHYGENIQFSTVSRVRPRFITSPTSSTLNYSHSNTDASSFTQNITTAYSNGWYDLVWSARWHKFELIFNGNTTISGFDLLMSPDGTE